MGSKDVYIDVQNVVKTYGKRESAFNALDGVGFGIKKGANIAILGKSGSGKSTLMHVMAGLDSPSSGKVIVGSQDIWSLSKKKLNSFRNKEIGFIFQTFYMQQNETVLKNVTLPLDIAGISGSKRKDLAAEALDKLDILEKAHSSAKDLSGGQKQRVCIARSIINSPGIIFADEPTGNLDSVNGAKVEEILFGLNKDVGTTLIIVTHDEDLASRCSGRILIKDGKIEQLQGKGFVK